MTDEAAIHALYQDLAWTLGDRLWRMLRLSTDTTPTL
jgi:hypothetical protein